jgi:hypothetical protein
MENLIEYEHPDGVAVRLVSNTKKLNDAIFGYQLKGPDTGWFTFIVNTEQKYWTVTGKKRVNKKFFDIVKVIRKGKIEVIEDNIPGFDYVFYSKNRQYLDAICSLRGNTAQEYFKGDKQMLKDF